MLSLLRMASHFDILNSCRVQNAWDSRYSLMRGAEFPYHRPGSAMRRTRDRHSPSFGLFNGQTSSYRLRQVYTIPR